MDRRLRSPARRPAAPRADERRLGSPHRFLRPGALARLRDSKVLARSLRCAARALIPPPSSSSASPNRPSPAPAAAAAGDGGVPCFLGSAARGSLRYPLRKKLAAARGVVFLPYPPEAAEPFVDAFAAAAAAAAAAPSSDLLAAH